MANYNCSKFEMSVSAKYGKCNKPLLNDNLKLNDGTNVQISKCPNEHRKIKSPIWCGKDMSCSI